MTIPEVSAKHEDPVEPAAQPLHDKDRVHPAGTHGEHHPEVGGILIPGHPRQVSRSIRTPPTKKRQDFGFEPPSHVPLLDFLLPLIKIILKD
jgi:hypothetical protein